MPLAAGLGVMDLFGDETLVKLRSRVHGTYLHADEDGAGVSLRAHGSIPSRNAVWRVRRLPTFRFVLQSTTTASYLAVSDDPAPPGFGGYRAVQRDYDGDIRELSPQDGMVWSVWRPATGDDQGDDTFAFLRNRDLSLRASGNHRIWHTGVTVDRAFNNVASSTPMRAHWAVEIVAVPADEAADAQSSSLREENSTGFSYLPSSKEHIAKTQNQWDLLETVSLQSPAKLSGKEFQPAESELQDLSSRLREEKNTGASLETGSLPSPAKLSGKEFQPAESEFQDSSSRLREEKNTRASLEKDSQPSAAKLSGKELEPAESESSNLIEEKNIVSYLPSSREQTAKTENQRASLEKDSQPSAAKLSGKELEPAESESSNLIEEKNIVSYLPSSREQTAKTENQRVSLELESPPSPAKLSEKEFQPVKSEPHCLGCSKNSSNCLCNKCRRRMKVALLKARGASLGTGNFCLCLKCLDLAQNDHGNGAHKTHCIVLDTFDGSQVAWVNQKEIWSAIFAGIQSDRYFNSILGRPFLLHSPQGWRCEVCDDYLSEDKLFETVIRFCTIECWACKAAAAPEFSWVKALLKSDFNRPGEHCYFCSVCRCVFNELEVQDHMHELEFQGLRVITDYMAGTAAIKIEVPSRSFYV